MEKDNIVDRIDFLLDEDVTHITDSTKTAFVRLGKYFTLKKAKKTANKLFFGIMSRFGKNLPMLFIYAIDIYTGKNSTRAKKAIIKLVTKEVMNELTELVVNLDPYLTAYISGLLMVIEKNTPWRMSSSLRKKIMKARQEYINYLEIYDPEQYEHLYRKELEKDETEDYLSNEE